MAAACKRSPSCEACAETRSAEPRISNDDADLRVIAGAGAGLASTGLTANTELPMFSRLTSNRLTLVAAAAALALAAGAAPLAAETMSEKTVNVGGAPMYPSKKIIQHAVNS